MVAYGRSRGDHLPSATINLSKSLLKLFEIQTGDPENDIQFPSPGQMRKHFLSRVYFTMRQRNTSACFFIADHYIPIVLLYKLLNLIG